MARQGRNIPESLKMGTVLRRGSAKHLAYSTKSVAALQPHPETLDIEQMRPRALSGGVKDSDRARIVKGFYDRLPDLRVIYLDVTKEVIWIPTRNQPIQILKYEVPDSRVAIIDRIEFIATPLVGPGAIPQWTIEGPVQFFFTIGKTVPVQVTTVRNDGLNEYTGAYFPTVNERVGATEVNFSLIAKTGQVLEGYYINRAASPVLIGSVICRIRGWIGAVSIIEEIMEQQR
jgi:hypothetical protein